jgi:hypothetical protein
VLSGVPTEGVDFVVPAPEPPLSNNTPFRFSPGPYACAPTLDWVCEESRSFSFDVAANSLLPRTTGRLSGTVTGKTGMPLLDVMVTLSREDTTLPLQYSTQTDFAGRYVFPNVRPGSYSIQVTIDGQRVVVRIEIEARDRQMDIGPLGAVAPAR